MAPVSMSYISRSDALNLIDYIGKAILRQMGLTDYLLLNGSLMTREYILSQEGEARMRQLSIARKLLQECLDRSNSEVEVPVKEIVAISSQLKESLAMVVELEKSVETPIPIQQFVMQSAYRNISNRKGLSPPSLDGTMGLPAAGKPAKL